MDNEVHSTAAQAGTLPAGRFIRDVQHTTCCIVGAGAAGSVLAFILARQGVPVLLLEKHHDFERQFRGDTLHPSVMEIMDQLGVADRLLQLHHTKASRLTFQAPQGAVTVADLSHLKTRYPFVTLLPQSVFLQFITTEAERYPNFRLIMGANVKELIIEDGVVRGVRYQTRDGWHQVGALLTVGADGRSSHIRRQAGLQPVTTSPPMDVLWFRLLREPGDPVGISGRVGPGHFLILLDRSEYWQAGYVIPKGGYQQLRSAGLEALRRSIVELAPEFADRVEILQDWDQIALLTVESSYLPRWYQPGLLLIGDAAHVMTPVGGVGINYAIQDAVVAANVLSGRLKQGQVQIRDLVKIQRQREWPTRVIQAWQTLLQQQLLAAGALDPTKPFRLPAFLRLPILRSLFPRWMGRMVGFGVWSVQVEVPYPSRDWPAELVALATSIFIYLMAERRRRLEAGIGSCGDHQGREATGLMSNPMN